MPPYVRPASSASSPPALPLLSMAAAPPNTPLSSATVAALDVRPVASLAEYAACVTLQEEVWGREFESVPASLLQGATYVGGLCIGAFTAGGELCGFVFGLAGTIDGRPTHWSHLLGVRGSARNLGAGPSLLTLTPKAGDDLLDPDDDNRTSLRIEVPTDFRQLLARSPTRATAWHAALRRHFLWALDAGYVVTGLHRDPLSSRSFYTLAAE